MPAIVKKWGHLPRSQTLPPCSLVTELLLHKSVFSAFKASKEIKPIYLSDIGGKMGKVD